MIRNTRRNNAIALAIFVAGCAIFIAIALARYEAMLSR